jgi:hypothetical protein
MTSISTGFKGATSVGLFSTGFLFTDRNMSDLLVCSIENERYFGPAGSPGSGRGEFLKFGVNARVAGHQETRQICVGHKPTDGVKWCQRVESNH